MQDWASLHGIDHQRTAPYMSAHNGRAERLHRTLLGKARAMCLSCNAPASFWAEFNATAAYLTNLTSSSSLNGRTPYEFWTGRVPSLSHLREIGCRAFALIQTNNPKIYRCSCPCILIGYAPHAKAYWLWDTVDGSIFNSFHVTFLERLDEQPVDLMPGTTVCIDPDATPSWDVPAHSDTTPPVPSPHTLPSSSCNSPGENRRILTPGGDFSNSTTDCDAYTCTRSLTTLLS